MAGHKQRAPLSELYMKNTQQDLDDFQTGPPPSKKLKKAAASDRFADPKTNQEMEKLSKGPVVPNTEKNTMWATRVFNQWRKHRNDCATSKEEKCPENLLEAPEPAKLNHWLSRFLVEVRCEDCQHYPATSLYQTLSGLLRYARSVNRDCPNFLDKKKLAIL